MSRSILSHSHSSPDVAWAKALAGSSHRRSLLAPALAASVLIGGVYGAYLALESPGALIRHDLASAGYEVGSLAWSTPTERVQQAVARHFPGYRVTVDAAGFPDHVTVTLHDLDRTACESAYRSADRLEGRVVIALETSDGTACRNGISLIWRIMP
jgi:hypothetical protein